MNPTDATSPEPAPQIETFEFDPLTIAEGEESKGIITLSRPAPPDTSITLEGVPAIAEFPALLLVPTSEPQVTFTAVATESFQGFQEMTFTARCFSSTKEARLRIGGEVWLKAPRPPRTHCRSRGSHPGWPARYAGSPSPGFRHRHHAIQ
jgi:hypothetical protein